MSYQSRVISSLIEIERIAPAWQALTLASGHAMNDPIWHANAARFAHGQGDALSILSVWQGETLVALAPLMLARGPQGIRYEIIGTRALYEPAEILARDRPASEWIAREIAALDRPVVLTRVPAVSEFNDAFMHAGRRAGWMLSPNSSPTPYVDLSAGWDSYYAGLPSRIKNVVRRGSRQLAKLGQVQLEFANPTAADTAAVLQQAFEVESRSWKGRAGSAVLQREDLREFFFHYGTQLAGLGELLVAFLRVDGAPIAMQVAKISRAAYWQLKIGYDERYSKYLPGLQLLLETIRWSFSQRLASYEFLGTNERWIGEWTDQVRDHKTMLFYPYSARGLAGLARDSLERARRKLPLRRRSLKDRDAT